MQSGSAFVEFRISNIEIPNNIKIKNIEILNLLVSFEFRVSSLGFGLPMAIYYTKLSGLATRKKCFLMVKYQVMIKKILLAILGFGLLFQLTTTSINAADVHGDCGDKSIDTAIGCLNVLSGQDQFLGAILKWAVGIGGGIAFLLIVYAGFMIMSAAGSPDRLKAGQELLTSALSGLILLVFSLFILKFIGIDILGLGDFGFGKTP